MKIFLNDKKNQLIFFLVILSAIEIPQAGIRFLFWILAGVSLAAAGDFFINRLFYKKYNFPNSAIISGFIVAGILDYRQSWITLIIFVLLAIVSKHLIKYKEKHFFNPANFSLFAATLFRIPLTWNIESNIYLIIIFGLYMAYLIKKMPHLIGFISLFSLLCLTQRINPLMLISWFFVFVMLIEPKTSGFGNAKGFMFGSIAGISSFLIFKLLPQYDFFVVGLFVANLCNPFLARLRRPAFNK